ncbi:MAG: RluA family pseudouridine synthase [Bacilli bacterium]|nr:RluA family pseudouridine synthase [Bacilli bacterium]
MKKNKKGKLDILFEDKHVLIVNKKGGLPTIKSENCKGNLYSQVYDYLHKKNQRVFVVHRLDKDTSGIVVFAKSEKVKNILQDNWDNVIRNYIAVVHGKTKEKDIITSYIKETKTLLSYSTNDKSGKFAKTTYERIMENKSYTLLKINIQTGRKNQIRLHMKDNKTPILGDRKYGKKDGYRNMMLLANQIKFTHPITKKEINIDLNIPENYVKIFKGDKYEGRKEL